MEEEVGIKVTRLRRRLSVEAEDVKSPSTQSTPTKKRGGRLAAKPQLELIAENAPEAVPKKTRKSTVKEAEPVEEKAVTPSRRSTRIKSNTSIVSETPGDVPEDKGTPSRRSTRIKSNTSLIAEPVNVNSPRAKRAARRTSLAGSDTETPITPTRTTRRTRNNSASSVDKSVEPSAGKLGGEIKEVIVEESENNVKETPSTESKNKSVLLTLRKSPRFSLDNENKENKPRSDKEASETTTAADKSLSEPKPEQTNEVVDQKASEKINISATSKNLIQELEEAPKKAKSIFNKSITAVEKPQIKTKRNRTKSWTTISVESPQDSSFCSDSEVTKKKNKIKNVSLNFSNISGSGDGIMNTSNKNNEAKKEQENVSLNSSTSSNKKKKKRHEMSMTIETETAVHEVSVVFKNEPNQSMNKSAAKLTESKDGSEDINNLNSSKQHNTSTTQKLFEQAPSGIVESIVFIEDSDSNQEKVNDKGFDSGDQCVPVVDHHLEEHPTANETKVNLSYEPMDIDETMPENVSLTSFEDKNNSTLEKRKSVMNMSQVKNDSLNKSKRKSVADLAEDKKINENSIKSPRKSSISEVTVNDIGDNNKSKRELSITNEVSEDTTDGFVNVSNRKSLVVEANNHDDSINNKKANKSKRKSSISNVTEHNTDADSNTSARKSINAEKSNDESINKETNKSKRSSISNIFSEESTNEISTKSVRKSSLDLTNDENMDKSINKSKRRSSVTAMVIELGTDDDMINKSSNKSQRKSSISNMANNDSIDKNSKNKSDVYLDKTENENKSTLVLSQPKDVSENEINSESNAAKDSNDSSEQLSRSVNVPSAATEKDDKKNLSLTYSTSTPLQQKSMKKLGLQINTSIIALNSANKPEKKDKVNRSKKEESIVSEEDGSDSSEEEEDDSGEDEEEDSEEDASLKKSKMIDVEAEEASDDYESGDSRDDEEIEYEKVNEIREKGETLDSDEAEFSDDSDYEKDSFIVSSDEEDNHLLSGSDDDLSMSADELTMTAKSKKKFDERKKKEQKKASREMYEARHKLNESDNSAKSPKSKKNNRQRFDTSSSESDEEVTAQPKKNRRQRIDSSHDASTLQSETTKSPTKKNKAKRLSESVCDEDETNEKEITIYDENQAEKDDPLTLLNVIKEEPKTPQKGLNISTVAVTNIDEVEEVNVDEGNTSIMKSNQTTDPLQATIAENDEEDITDEGSISENEEITQNYESILNNLNKSGSKKIKASNISLDLNKKTKQVKEPIIDQLNLTQVKKSKKNKVNAAENRKQDTSLNKSADKVAKPDTTLSEGSSDCIDMKLLFPEDSNDSEVLTAQKKQAVKETTDKEDDEEAPSDYIPLKRTPGKTNILENMDIANKSKDECLFNVSGKKKNKRKSYQSQDTLEMGAPEDENLGFFIDTTGTLADENKTDANVSIKNSAKKNKQKNNVSFTGREQIPLDDDSNEAPLEVSYRNEKNKSKQDLNTTQNNEDTKDVSVGTPSQSGKKKKKKNKKGLNGSQNVAEISVIESAVDVAEKSVNVSVSNVEGSVKKKKKRLSESQTVPETDDSNEAPLEVSYRNEKNKSKQDLNTTQNNEDTKDVSVGTPSQSGKKKKKKNKKGLNGSQNVAEISVIESAVDVAEKSINVSVSNVEGSVKKKKKRLSESQTVPETVNEEPAQPILNISLGSAKKQKQRNNSENNALEAENINKENEDVFNQDLVAKKRKRKSSANQTIDEIIVKDDVKVTHDKSMTTKNKKKKRKISNNDEDKKIQVEDALIEIQDQESTAVVNTKKKSKVQHLNVNEIDEGAKKKNKKRKERDDDDATEISKVLKQNSFDKVHVPRLPSNIIEQLGDKPKTDVNEAKKTEVVSTSEFVVEETKRRRNKPSNYLEETVFCIDDDDMDEKKRKRAIKNPKVLPFIPTASISDSGFTTKFKVNVITQQTQFVAQSSDISNFKNDYLHKKRVKKLGTFEMYKRQRNIKIAKF